MNVNERADLFKTKCADWLCPFDMKGDMESGEFSRVKESIRADGSLVPLDNFKVDVEHQATSSARCLRKCGMIPPLSAAFKPISAAGMCPRWTRPCLPTTFD